MVKFATALCVLLVAYGAQADSLWSTLESEAAETAYTTSASMSTLASEIASLVSSLISENPLLSSLATISTAGITTMNTEIESINEKLYAAWNSTLAVAEDMASEANSTMTSAISQMITLVDSYSNSTVNVSSCSSIVTEFESVANATLQNATSCAATYVSEIATEYNTTVNNMSTMMTKLYSMAKSASSCATDIFEFPTCMAESLADVTTINTDELPQVIANATSLMTSMSAINTELAACGFSTAETNVQSSLVTYSKEYVKCAEQLISNAA